MKISRRTALRLCTTLFVVSLAFLLSPVQSEEPEVKVPRDHFIAQFRDIEIADFLKTMAQITRKNILIDDSVKGKITVVSYKPIPVSRALDFLKQVLEVKGFAVVEEPNLIKVLQVDRAGSSSQPQEESPTSDSAGLISQVIRLPAGVNVTELAGILKGVADKTTTVTPYRPTNAIIITGYAQHVRRVLSLMKEMGADKAGPGGPAGSTDTVHIYLARHMKAETLADVLVRLDNPLPLTQPTQTGGDANQQQQQQQQQLQQQQRPAGKIKAVAHKESNSVIVTAGQQEWNEILQIITQLDQVRKQILLEVLIAEVTSSSLNDFGIDWRYQGRNGPHTQFNSGFAAEGGLVNPENGRITGNNTLSGFSLGFLQKGGELLGIFNANVKNQNFNVLSAPQVLTLDNQEAEINVGQDVPVRTQERKSGGGQSEATVNSFEYRPSGIKLKFTPHINPEGRVALDLFGEVTNIEGANSAQGNPTFNKRNVKTYVTVDNKQTIVIGGLVSNERLQSVSKIPLLGDIPFLGYFFRRTTWSTKRTNLMVFITPHVLEDREDADRISIYKRNEQIEASRNRKNEVKLWPEGDAPRGRKDEIKVIDKP